VFRLTGDKWGVDVAVTGSQKALSLPTGLAVVCAGKKALAKMASAKLKRDCYVLRCVHLLGAGRKRIRLMREA
jgi:aspartate aminotransferase-like enzyme